MSDPPASAAARARQMLQGLGLPDHDPGPRAPSSARFTDGAAVGLEVAGVQGPADLAELLDECDRLGTPPPERVIETKGFGGLTRAEARDMVAACAARGVGLVASIGPRAGRGLGSFSRSAQGGRLACRLRGADQLARGLEDALRSVDRGVRCLLVYDEGLLDALRALRAQGDLPEGLRFKASVALGCANPAHARVLARLGADSLNLVNDLPPGMLAAVRDAVSIPLDVHVDDHPDAGRPERLFEVPALVEAAAPVFLKCGSGARGPGNAGKARRLARLAEALDEGCPGVARLGPGAVERGVPVPS